MDIKHLEYFITIVDNRFNLSKAADVLYVSQPALTKYIKDFETQEKMSLFIRYKGRLVDLTPAGKEFYKNAKSVVQDFHNLMENLHNPDVKIRGTVKIGIPPMIISVLFHSAIPNFILQNPDIDLQIVEAGASELQKMLLTQEIDIAFLIEPISLPNISHQRVLTEHIAVVFNSEHPLAKKSGTTLTYHDLEHEQLVIFNETFMLHDQIIKNFRFAGITPNIFFKSREWDLLSRICESMNVITFLPLPILEQYPQKNIAYKTLEPDFPWLVALAKLNNVYHSDLINYTEKYFLTVLKENK